MMFVSSRSYPIDKLGSWWFYWSEILILSNYVCIIGSEILALGAGYIWRISLSDFYYGICIDYERVDSVFDLGSKNFGDKKCCTNPKLRKIKLPNAICHTHTHVCRLLPTFLTVAQWESERWEIWWVNREEKKEKVKINRRKRRDRW